MLAFFDPSEILFHFGFHLNLFASGNAVRQLYFQERALPAISLTLMRSPQQQCHPLTLTHTRTRTHTDTYTYTKPPPKSGSVRMIRNFLRIETKTRHTTRPSRRAALAERNSIECSELSSSYSTLASRAAETAAEAAKK